MDDDVAKVYQHPTVGRLAFDAFGHALALLLGAFQRRLGQGPQLWLRVAAANDEVVGEDRLGMEIEGEDVAAFLVEQGIDQYLS